MATAGPSLDALATELQALRNETQRDITRLNRAVDTTYSLFCAVVIFLMQAGFTMLEAGSVRERSVRDVLFKNLLDVSIGALMWFLIGYVLSSDGGSNGFVGLPQLGSFNASEASPFDVLVEFHPQQDGLAVAHDFMAFMYATTSATIVSGAVAERTQQRAYIFSSATMTAVVYPIVAHWLWSTPGWLSYRGTQAFNGGAFDFAGGGVVHLTGGVMALVAAAIVGPRAGRFHPTTRMPIKMRGSSSALFALGTVLLWIGWIGFNVGSTHGIVAEGAPLVAAQTAMRTTLAGSAGALAALTASRCRHKVGPLGQWGIWSFEHAANGLLAGLVSVTAGAPVLGDVSSILVGAIGGLLYYGASHFVQRCLMIDDVIDAFAVHGVCGLWSLLAVGLLAESGTTLLAPGGHGALCGGDGRLLANNLLASVCISLWAMGLGVMIFMPLRGLGFMRIPTDFEIIGIDIAELGRVAYDRGIGLEPGQAVNAVARPISPTISESTSGHPTNGTLVSPANEEQDDNQAEGHPEAVPVDSLGVEVELSGPPEGGPVDPGIVVGRAISSA